MVFESVVRRYLGDRVTGRGARGEEMSLRCPFHKHGMEEHPSFTINLNTGLSYCHTCGKGWNIFTLLVDLGVDRETARQVAELVPGVTTVDEEPESAVLPEWVVASWLTRCPKVLLDAGFDMNVLREYEVGWDDEHGRIVFPIRDYRGVLVAVQGRNVRIPSKGRYVVYHNELERLLDVKLDRVPISHHIWNLHRWYRRGIDDRIDRLIIVEGVKKALWLIQNGFPETVSIFSAHMSEEQHRLLSRLSIGVVVSMLDNDGAGRAGTERIRKLLSSFNVVVPEWPVGKTQPDGLDALELDRILNDRRSACRVQCQEGRLRILSVARQ